MNTDEIRKRFLDFFASKGHKIYPSDTLVPKDDPTLLFTSAGMNQFKQEFISKPAEFTRRATCQKCLRTGDLDKVGKTSYHHTFFEMLGNFSFGDYFKNEAISFAWEFVTEELKLKKDNLWVSVYLEDQQAYDIWKEKIGLDEARICKFGAKDNFWPSNAPQLGPNGPCGPCSEIFFDQGKDVGCGRSDCNPSCDCGRFVEVWNLVFTQFDRQGENKLAPLANKNIDTGMGLERIAAVMQGASNNFEIDVFKPIAAEIIDLSPVSGEDLQPKQISARNAIADHIRAVTFAIADGILPSNDERGYVIRKLIRRAVWHGRSLGIEKPYLYKVVPRVTRMMNAAYPELESKREEIAQVVLAEERRFRKTLERAVEYADQIIAKLKSEGKNKLPGREAFKLYDTYGLPFEMLEILVISRGFELDEDGFNLELEAQRKSSRKTSSMEESVFVDTLVSKYKLKPTKFVGDKVYFATTKVLAIFDQDDQAVEEAKEGDKVKTVLETTPFYGESGGQVGDTGIIKNKEVEVAILDTRKLEHTFIHIGEVLKGKIKVGDIVEPSIELERRKDIARNHTATHLLQWALRKVLGEHVRQSGSWVGPDRLRFDFTHFQALTERELQRVEQLVNDEIRKNTELDVEHMPFEQAQEKGALAFFGEKYQENVRVVAIGEVSMELCGGTHVSSTGEIKLFKIVHESSVASGIRRIEAVTAKAALGLLKKQEEELEQYTRNFQAAPDKLPQRIEELLRSVKELNRRLDKSRLENFKKRIEQIVKDALQIMDATVVTLQVGSADMRLLRSMSDLLREKVRPSVVILGSVWEDKVQIICAVTKELCAKGLDAARIIRTIAKEVDGSGGGRADFAQAGGRNPRGLNKALGLAQDIVKKELNKK
ncbi:MAG: alanine--tRNA ligase [Candidatus Omnitrophica bacterium]|nr:alanine--tRNA ligase [Candidatus Omnitrophota bacterium]